MMILSFITIYLGSLRALRALVIHSDSAGPPCVAHECLLHLRALVHSVGAGGHAGLSFACVILTCLLTSAVLLHVCAVGESSLELLSQRRLSPFCYRVLNAALAPSPVGGAHATSRH